VKLPTDFTAFAKWVDGAHFTLSVRLHAAILAANLGIPSISLGYRDKNLDFMQSIGQERWHIPLETASLDETTDAIKAMEADAHGSRGSIHAQMLSYRDQVTRYATRMVTVSP
jgi:polysaccharide pyruvyl transferase WcaK-like protein